MNTLSITLYICLGIMLLANCILAYILDVKIYKVILLTIFSMIVLPTMIFYTFVEKLNGNSINCLTKLLNITDNKNK